MNALRQSLLDYLSLRRALGYKLRRSEKLLHQFLDFLDASGAPTITTQHALAWACQPANGDANWWADRLSVVRVFATYVHAQDARAQVPPRDLLPCRPRRATPYLYSEREITALVEAAGGLRTTLRKATYRTLIGLLATTGMRVGEAIDLDRGDFDAAAGVVLIRRAKFDKTREIPLHPTTVTALRRCGAILPVLRHSAAMRLLESGVRPTVIALWLGHERVDTTAMYLHAHLGIKESALARARMPDGKPRRYRPPDALLAFLQSL